MLFLSPQSQHPQNNWLQRHSDWVLPQEEEPAAAVRTEEHAAVNPRCTKTTGKRQQSEEVDHWEDSRSWETSLNSSRVDV